MIQRVADASLIRLIRPSVTTNVGRDGGARLRLLDDDLPTRPPFPLSPTGSKCSSDGYRW